MTTPKEPLPDNVTDLADLVTCSACGQTYDLSWIDEVLYHQSGHTITDATRGRGVRIDPEPLPPPPQPRPGLCNVARFGRRCELVPDGHVRLPNGCLEHRSGAHTFVIFDENAKA